MTDAADALNNLPAGTLEAIRGVLAEPFAVFHLHPWPVRFRRRYAQDSLSLPTALKLITDSGRLFKLYVGHAPRRYQRMQKHARQGAATGLFPAVVWHDDQALLMEFLPGRPAKFSDDGFARDLGHAMAALHGLKQTSCDDQRIQRGLRRDLVALQSAGVLRDVAGYEAALLQLWPHDLVSSLDYSDIKPGNFVRDDANALRLIDLGALRTQRPAGQYLCGSLYLRRLDRGSFASAYLEAGGLPQVIEQARFLRMLHCVWLSALYLRKMQEVPRWLPVHRLSYRFLVGYLLWEFRRLAKRESCGLASL